MTPIPVLHCFARSGGTLVNQLLGVHPRCLVLSEVNPAASFKPVAEQAVDWLGLAAREEKDELARLPYSRQLALLAQRAGERGKTLVVRDWVTVNFAPGTARDPIAASGLLEQPLYLRREGLEPRPLVIARRARDVVRSARTNFPGLAAQGELAQAYLRYAKAVAGLPRVHLESLRAAPQETVARILDLLGLDAVDPTTLLRDFHRFDRCTGNNTLAQSSASARATTILGPEPPAAGGDEHPALAQADAILGYD